MIGLNNKKIGFILDSSSTIKDGQYDDVKIIPIGISVQIGNEIKSYKDGVDFLPQDLVDAFNKKAIVRTSQATMQEMVKAATEMCQKYDVVYAFPIHKNLSSNINTWKILKEDFPNLNVVMTLDCGNSSAWSILEVKEFLKTNEGGEDAVQRFFDEKIVPYHCGFVLVEDLTQLIRGGRVKGAKAVLGKLFKIKPIILFDENGLLNFATAKDHEDFFKVIDKHIAEKYAGKKIKKVCLYPPFNNPSVRDQYVAEFVQHYGNIPYEVVDLTTCIAGHIGDKYVAIHFKFE